MTITTPIELATLMCPVCQTEYLALDGHTCIGHMQSDAAAAPNNPSVLNLARARHILASPHLPWTTEIKQALAQAYIDHTQALSLLNAALDDLEKEVTTMRNQMKVVEDELSSARADLRYLCGVKS